MNSCTNLNMKLYTLLFSVFCVFITNAQTTSVKKNQFKFNFLTPGIEYERGLDKKSTISLNLSTGMLSTNTFLKKRLALYPTADVQYKYYFNLSKRASKQKRTLENSGNYISILGRFQSGKSIIGDIDFLHKYTFYGGLVTGFQRTHKSGINITADLGIVRGYNDIGGKGYLPFANIKFGWVLFMNKSEIDIDSVQKDIDTMIHKSIDTNNDNE